MMGQVGGKDLEIEISNGTNVYIIAEPCECRRSKRLILITCLYKYEKILPRIEALKKMDIHGH